MIRTAVFRCDASPDIGLGHLIRCLAVANELKDRNDIIFATIKDDTNAYIKRGGFGQILKEESESEEAFLHRIKDNLRPDIIAIDKKYAYSPDSLKDLNYVMVDKEGLEYVVLRKDILELKEKVNHELHTPPNIVITTGGADPEGVLIKLIPWLKEMNLDINILILVGQAFKFRNELEHLMSFLPDNFHVMPYSLQELIKGDIAICTFGVSIYELIYLQIPIICISHTLENAEDAKILKERYGVIENMGHIKDINPHNLYMVTRRLLTDKRYYKNMVDRCDSLIDGKGAKRVGQIIIGRR